MKRKISKTVMILCALLVITVISGCGKETEKAGTDQNVEEATEDKTDSVTDEDKADPVTDEEQPAEPDEESVVNGLALKGPSYTGLSVLKNENNEDGTYFYQDMTEDCISVITNMCSNNSQRDGQDPDAYAENFVCAVVDDTGSARITDSEGDDDLSASLTYPSYRVHWETGSNEDSRENIGVVVLTENYTFYYGYGCPADYYDENAEFYGSELGSIELIDLAAMGDGASVEADAGDPSAAEGGNSAYGVYIDKINELKSEGLADQFALEKIDGDDIPELIASDANGSFDHENAFIFTIFNDEAVQLAAVMTGVDGGNLDYAKGADLIHISGAVAGMRDNFYKISDGKLEEVFSAEVMRMDEDAKYLVNGNSVKEDEYYKQINGFMENYNPMTRVAYDGLYEVSYRYENGYGGFEQGASEKYSSADDISKELK